MTELSPFARPEVQQARQQAQTATGQYVQAGATATELPDALRQAVTERFKESPLYGQFQGAAQNVLTAVPEYRKTLADLVGSGTVLSPNQQQALLARRQASAIVPLISLNDLLKSQTGGMEELIGAGTRAFGAQTQRLGGIAELLTGWYKDILNQLVAEENIRQAQQQFSLQKLLGLENLNLQRQSQALAQQQFEWQKSQPTALDTQVVEANNRKYLVNTQTGQIISDLGIAAISSGTKKTEAEKQAEALVDLRSDIQRGATLDEVMRAYSDTFAPLEILSQYNIISGYGPAKESPSELYTKYGINYKPPEEQEEKPWWKVW